MVCCTIMVIVWMHICKHVCMYVCLHVQNVFTCAFMYGYMSRGYVCVCLISMSTCLECAYAYVYMSRMCLCVHSCMSTCPECVYACVYLCLHVQSVCMFMYVYMSRVCVCVCVQCEPCLRLSLTNAATYCGMSLSHRST